MLSQQELRNLGSLLHKPLIDEAFLFSYHLLSCAAMRAEKQRVPLFFKIIKEMKNKDQFVYDVFVNEEHLKNTSHQETQARLNEARKLFDEMIHNCSLLESFEEALAEEEKRKKQTRIIERNGQLIEATGSGLAQHKITLIQHSNICRLISIAALKIVSLTTFLFSAELSIERTNGINTIVQALYTAADVSIAEDPNQGMAYISGAFVVTLMTLNTVVEESVDNLLEMYHVLASEVKRGDIAKLAFYARNVHRNYDDLIQYVPQNHNLSDMIASYDRAWENHLLDSIKEGGTSIVNPRGSSVFSTSQNACKTLKTITHTDKMLFDTEVFALQEVQGCEYVICYRGSYAESSSNGSLKYRILMESIEYTLQDWLRDDAVVIDSPELLNVMIGTINALAWVHSKGLVHSDVKPSNICIRNDNGQKCVKLLDFGYCVTTGQLQRSCTEFFTLPILYNSPVSQKRDLYAFGVMLQLCILKMQKIERVDNNLQRPNRLEIIVKQTCGMGEDSYVDKHTQLAQDIQTAWQDIHIPYQPLLRVEGRQECIQILLDSDDRSKSR